MRQLKITQSVTNRSTKAVDKYLADISRIGMVDKEREVELAIKIKQGDQKALDELVYSNLRFVVSVSKQYQNRGVDLIDLINDGNLGLIKAAKRFDETKGFKFISYAVWWVRQSILESVSNNGRLIRVPLNKIGLQNKFLKSYSKLEQELGRQPEDEEVMIEMGIEAKEMQELLQNMCRIHSYNAPISNETESSESLLDIMKNPDDAECSPDKHLVSESMKLDIKRCLDSLNLPERTVIEKYFGLNGVREMTLSEIGEEMNKTSERIRQIKEKGMRQLRVFKKPKLLKKYLN